MADTACIGVEADFPPGEIRASMLPDGTVVAVHNVDGRLYVTQDRCSHGDASLSEEGSLCGNIVECPWHFGTFDVVTGKPTGLPCTKPLKIYPVVHLGADIHVRIDREAAGDEPGGGPPRTSPGGG